ncbi:MAG: O-antigen ligase family protein [Halomonas sp.]|nr:O-antigen ligase family protein [Halomonas sp.]
MINLLRISIFSLVLKLAFIVIAIIYIAVPEILGWSSESREASVLTTLSLLWFAGIFAGGIISEKFYWALAPPIILFTPNAINDFFYSHAMGEASRTEHFSYLTHIDIYLIVGIILYSRLNLSISKTNLVLLSVTVLAFLISMIFSYCNDRLEIFWFGNFQLRYFLLLLFIFCFANPHKYEKYFSISLMASSIMIFGEAILYSFINDYQRLTSGNYGVNTLGHLLAAMTVFAMFSKPPFNNTVAKYSLIALFFLGCLLTGTRFSIMALIGGASIVFFIRNKKVAYFFIAAFACLLVLLGYLTLIPSGISLREGFIVSWDSFQAGQQIPITPDTSSIATRIKLWGATLNMLGDYPWLGVSPGGWAFSKNEYAINYLYVLDPHNELLNIAVSYGMIIGLFLFYYIYIFPCVKSFYLSPKSNVWPWLSIVVVLLVAGVSNAVTWKHQVAFLVLYSSLLVVTSERNFFRNECKQKYIHNGN